MTKNDVLKSYKLALNCLENEVFTARTAEEAEVAILANKRLQEEYTIIINALEESIKGE